MCNVYAVSIHHSHQALSLSVLLLFSFPTENQDPWTLYLICKVSKSLVPKNFNSYIVLLINVFTNKHETKETQIGQEGTILQVKEL